MIDLALDFLALVACTLAIIAAAVAGAALHARRRGISTPAAPTPRPLLPEEVGAIARDAQRDARVDHALGVPSRKRPYPPGQAAGVWSTEYERTRHALEEHAQA